MALYRVFASLSMVSAITAAFLLGSFTSTWFWSISAIQMERLDRLEKELDQLRVSGRPDSDSSREHRRDNQQVEVVQSDSGGHYRREVPETEETHAGSNRQPRRSFRRAGEAPSDSSGREVAGQNIRAVDNFNGVRNKNSSIVGRQRLSDKRRLRSGNRTRNLAYLGMTEWYGAEKNTGCVLVTMYSDDIEIPVNRKACNGHRCPPCFTLDSSYGSGAKHPKLTIRGCSTMWLSDYQRIGSGDWYGTQVIQFINAGDAEVLLSDGLTTFAIPVGAHIDAPCAPSGDELAIPNALRRYPTAGSSWELSSKSSGWTERSNMGAVMRKDGSIVILGGYGSVPSGYGGDGGEHGTDGGEIGGYGGEQRRPLNDVWASPPSLRDSRTGLGLGFYQLVGRAPWSPRMLFGTVVRPDGGIVIMGGWNGTAMLQDVWASTDGGSRWNLIRAQVPWEGRCSFPAVVVPSGDIVIMGGAQPASGTWSRMADVWASADGGVTWELRTGDPGFPARDGHAAVVNLEGKIVLMGGQTGGDSNRGEDYMVTMSPEFVNDVYVSDDEGYTFYSALNSAPWGRRHQFSAVVRVDGTILIMGGSNASQRNNEVWASRSSVYEWETVTNYAPWQERHGTAAVTTSTGAVFLLGGGTGAQSGSDGEVWYSMGDASYYGGT